MYTPFNHHFIIHLAILNNLLKIFNIYGKKLYKMCLFKLIGGQELIITNFPDLRPS